MAPGRGVITITRSDRNTASEIEWVTNSTVFCVRCQTVWRSTCICSRVRASSAPNGSSISSIGGSRSSARQSATRWRMPPESSNGRLSSNPSSPTEASSSRARSTWAFSSSPRITQGSSTLPVTVRQSSSKSLWNTKPRSV